MTMGKIVLHSNGYGKESFCWPEGLQTVRIRTISSGAGQRSSLIRSLSPIFQAATPVRIGRPGASTLEKDPAGGMHPHLEEAPLLADLKNAMRQFRRSPGFALTVVLTVALGVGATTAIFTLVHAVLLKSLPVEDPGGLWRVGDNEQCCLNGGLPDYQEPMYDWSLFSYRQYEQFRDHTPGFASLAAFESTDHEMAVRRAGDNQPAQPWYGEFVSGNSFATLG